jgi:nucleoside-diphosphate-sugar epimerase
MLASRPSGRAWAPRRAQRVLAHFRVQALLGQHVTVSVDGLQTRLFWFVDDLIDGLESMHTSPDITGSVNVRNPAEFTIIELAQTTVISRFVLEDCLSPLSEK